MNIELSGKMSFEITALSAALSHGDYKIDPILILRPLSDMTEEEKTEAHNLYFEDKESRKLLPYFDVGHFELTRFFLSKHFDLFQLIEAGLAIDKTKVNLWKRQIKRS